MAFIFGTGGAGTITTTVNNINSTVNTIAAGGAAQDLGIILPGGLSIVAGGGSDAWSVTNRGATADPGSAAGVLLSTADLTMDGAICPRMVFPVAAAARFAGLRYTYYNGIGIPLVVGPNPSAALPVRRTMFGTWEMHDTINLSSVVSGSGAAMWVFWGFGYRTNANGVYWHTGVFFVAQIEGNFNVSPPTAFGGVANWQCVIGGDSVNIADPTPILHGPVDSGVPWLGTTKLGIRVTATDDSTPLVQWYCDDVLVNSLNAVTAKFDQNNNGLTENFAPGYGAYVRDNTSTDTLQVRWNYPGMIVRFTQPTLP